MKSAIFVVACLVLAGAACGRELEQNSATSCRVTSALRIVLKHGKCSGWARAECSAQAKGDSEVAVETRQAFSIGICKPAQVRVHARAIAVAVARVYTSALSKITCAPGSHSKGCAFSVSRGDAVSTAFAKTIVEAATFAFKGDASALCVADISAVAQTIASAMSNSLSKTCIVNAGTAALFQSNFVEVAAAAITRAFVASTAKACSGEHSSDSKCSIDVSATSTSGLRVRQSDPTTVVDRPGDNRLITGSASGVGVAAKLKDCSPTQLTCCFAGCPNHHASISLDNGSETLVLFKGPGRTSPQCACY